MAHTEYQRMTIKQLKEECDGRYPAVFYGDRWAKGRIVGMLVRDDVVRGGEGYIQEDEEEEEEGEATTTRVNPTSKAKPRDDAGAEEDARAEETEESDKDKERIIYTRWTTRQLRVEFEKRWLVSLKTWCKRTFVDLLMLDDAVMEREEGGYVDTDDEREANAKTLKKTLWRMDERVERGVRSGEEDKTEKEEQQPIAETVVGEDAVVEAESTVASTVLEKASPAADPADDDAVATDRVADEEAMELEKGTNPRKRKYLFGNEKTEHPC